MIEFRHSRAEDLPRIMELVAHAQAWFKAEGIDQWQDGYPTESIFEADRAAKNSYVGVENGQIILAATLCFDGEPTYATIYDGCWPNEALYAVVHRLVVDPARKGEGVAGRLLDELYRLCRLRGIADIRIDTHRHNRPMQRLLERHGFRHCGRIRLESGADREAYHLRIF